ncbi:MAG: YiiX/YebB-like N1pC/P60 family cysteine hydrolase [Candidatus Eremiobacterota bacterium]
MFITTQLAGRPSLLSASGAPPAPPADPPAEEPEERFSLGKTLAGGLLFFMGRRIPTTVPEISPEKAEQLKQALKPGDVILTADCAYPGWARMEFWTVRSNYTHAAYYAGDGKILEAVGGGVKEAELDDYFSGRTKVAIIRPPYASEEDVQAATAFCKSHVGKKYDSVFNTGDDNEFYCSELVYKALKSMPHPIEAPSRVFAGKTAVAPDAFQYIQGATMVHDDKSGYFTNKLGHWPLAASAVGCAVAGGLLAGAGAAVAGFGVGLLGSIMIGNKIQTGHYLPSLHDLAGSKKGHGSEEL